MSCNGYAYTSGCGVGHPRPGIRPVRVVPAAACLIPCMIGPRPAMPGWEPKS